MEDRSAKAIVQRNCRQGCNLAATRLLSGTG